MQSQPYHVCLGVHEGDYHEMHLLPEPLFTLQTDNVYMSGITGTINGRIFLCGRDGCVYEMDYQVQYSMYGIHALINIIGHRIASISINYYYCIIMSEDRQSIIDVLVILGSGKLVWKEMQESQSFC